MQPIKAIAARQKVEYKRPSRFNLVSISVALVLAGAVYTAYSLWPVLALRSAVEGELADALPHLWRLNLRPVATTNEELPKLKQSVLERLRKAGVTDKKLAVVFERGKKTVAMQAKFTATAVFPWWKKRLDINCAPRVETDAARVDW
jgi:hypothetical protein